MSDGWETPALSSFTDTGMLAFIVLLSQPEHTSLTRVATAWQLGLVLQQRTPQGYELRALLVSLSAG